MPYLSVTEINKKLGIAESTIRLWLKEGKIPCIYEVRNGRQVQVIDEAEILARTNRNSTGEDPQNEDTHESAGIGQTPTGLQVVQYYQEQLSMQTERIIKLERENGLLEGQLQQVQTDMQFLKEQVAERAAEAERWHQQVIQVWQRLENVEQTAATKETNRPWWKKLLGK